MRAWLFCGLVLLGLAATPASAADLSIENLLGRWCQPSGPAYTFTRARLTVKFSNGTTTVWEIARVEASPDWINVIWTKKDSNTVFHNFSADGGQMFQAANTSGDNGPEISFHRC